MVEKAKFDHTPINFRDTVVVKALLQQAADDEQLQLSEYLRAVIREHLEAKGRWPLKQTGVRGVYAAGNDTSNLFFERFEDAEAFAAAAGLSEVTAIDAIPNSKGE